MKRAQIKQHILSTASDLFYKNGYNLTGINEVIALSDIAKATLYKHFPSKEALCLAYLQLKNEAFLRDIENFCKVRPTGANQVLAIFDYLKAFYRSPDFNGCWNHNLLAEIPANDVVIRNEIKKHQKSFIRYIKTLLLENFPFLLAADATILSRKIYLLFQSAWVAANLHRAKWPLDDNRAMCATFFI